jgi:hypothetical protein
MPTRKHEAHLEVAASEDTRARPNAPAAQARLEATVVGLHHATGIASAGTGGRETRLEIRPIGQSLRLPPKGGEGAMPAPTTRSGDAQSSGHSRQSERKKTLSRSSGIEVLRRHGRTRTLSLEVQGSVAREVSRISTTDTSKAIKAIKATATTGRAETMVEHVVLKKIVVVLEASMMKTGALAQARAWMVLCTREEVR